MAGVSDEVLEGVLEGVLGGVLAGVLEGVLGGVSDEQNRLGFNHPRRGEHVETETLSNREKPKRLRDKKLGPAWVWGHEDRSDLETEKYRTTSKSNRSDRDLLAKANDS